MWSKWVESNQALGGFRVLKKTLEAPYTTKVNFRMCTSRGTTRRLSDDVYYGKRICKVLAYDLIGVDAAK